MNLDVIRDFAKVKAYHIKPGMKVPPHTHDDIDEVFYCVDGTGYGIVEGNEVELSVGKTVVARAGELHTLKTDSELFVAAIHIPVSSVVCKCKQVTYADIKTAMVNGARTVDEIKEMTGAGTGCGGCIPDIEKILSVACGCKDVSVESVVEAVKNGADTVEKVGEVTGAGTGCGRCKALLQNIIDTKR